MVEFCQIVSCSKSKILAKNKNEIQNLHELRWTFDVGSDSIA